MAALLDLTPRELEVLQLVLGGRTRKTIAVEIGKSEKLFNLALPGFTQSLACARACSPRCGHYSMV